MKLHLLNDVTKADEECNPLSYRSLYLLMNLCYSILCNKRRWSQIYKNQVQFIH